LSGLLSDSASLSIRHVSFSFHENDHDASVRTRKQLSTPERASVVNMRLPRELKGVRSNRRRTLAGEFGGEIGGYAVTFKGRDHA